MRLRPEVSAAAVPLRLGGGLVGPEGALRPPAAPRLPVAFIEVPCRTLFEKCSAKIDFENHRPTLSLSWK